MTSHLLRARRARHALLTCLFFTALGTGSCDRGAEPEDAATTDPSLLPARRLYRAHCSACHGKDGRGARRLFPPLTGSTWATGDPSLPIRVVLHGLEGTLTLDGVTYMNRMPPLGQRLSDSEVAAILTFVRASWGNRMGPVSAAEVGRVRAATRSRDRPYRVEELR
jgi:mono/diheme cytochrome c family protein